jgi:hypothetical protein
MSQTSPRPVVPSSNEGLVIPTSGETEIPPRVSEDTHGPPLTANQGRQYHRRNSLYSQCKSLEKEPTRPIMANAKWFASARGPDAFGVFP